MRPWLYRIASNYCINELRRARAVGMEWLAGVQADSGRTPADRLFSRQRFGELVDDVQALPDRQRTALLLVEIDGFTYRRVATAMDTSVAAATKSLLVRARASLRQARDARLASPASGASTRDRSDIRARGIGPTTSYPAVRAAARLAASDTPRRARAGLLGARVTDTRQWV